MSKISIQTLFVVFLVSSFESCNAWFCQDWCGEPFCSCQAWFPRLQSFIKTNRCNEGYSGDQCQCPFSRTNVADNSFLIPDSLKGSLTVTKTSGNLLLVGTWEGGYESSSTSDPNQFASWGDDQAGENVWSLAKTSSGNNLIGSHSWIKIRTPGETAFRTVLDVGTQGGLAVVGHNIFAGTWEGLYLSKDEGETWTKSPTDCASYGQNQFAEPIQKSLVPKPPDEARYCDESVTHLFTMEDGSLIAFYMGYGGAHRIQLQNGDDPLRPESWQALPSFQDSASICESMFCHAQGAAVLGNYLYVAFQSLPMARLNLAAGNGSWEVVSIGVDSIDDNDLYPTAVTTADGTRIFAATRDGLYQSVDGTVWQRVSDEACNWRHKPPFMDFGGMVDYYPVTDDTTTDGGSASSSSVIVFGTVYGPWVYRV